LKLHLNAYKAVQEYRKYVELVVTSTHREDEREDMLSLERFAVWLEEEWPRFTEAEA